MSAARKRSVPYPDRRTAVAGEVFFVKDRTLARVLIGADEGNVEVKPKSAGQAGQWICICCAVPLANNWEKDSHCERPAPRKSCLVGEPPKGTPAAKHVLAWRSFDSGNVEEP